MTYRIWANGLELTYYDFSILTTFSKFGEATFSVDNDAANITACGRGKVVWILDDSTLKFVGEVVGYDETKATGLIKIRAFDISYRLVTRNSGERKSWTSQTLATVVAQHVVPVTGGTRQFGYSVPSVSGITWRNEYGSAIVSLAKLCQSYKMDWYADAGDSESANVGSVDSEIAITISGVTFATSGEGIEDSFIYVMNGSAAGRGGMVSSNTTTQATCTNATWQTWGLQSGDTLKIWRVDASAPTNNNGFRFVIEQRKGSASPTETVDLRDDLDRGDSQKMEKLRNTIYLLGRGDGGDAGQLYTKINHATIIRSTLSSDINSSTLSIPIADASGFPDTGTVVVGFEKISYISKTVNTLNGSARGVDSGTGSPNWLAAYAHNSGIAIYLYQTGATVYNESTPQVGSSIALEGVKEYKKTYLNIDEQNALDFMAQSVLAQLLYDREQSAFKLNRALTTAVPGDAITIVDFGGTSKTYRLMGVTYDWKTDTDTIEVNEVNAGDSTTESVGLTDRGIVSTVADLKDESEFNSAYNQGLLSSSAGIAYDSSRLGGVLAANYMRKDAGAGDQTQNNQILMAANLAMYSEKQLKFFYDTGSNLVGKIFGENEEIEGKKYFIITPQDVSSKTGFVATDPYICFTISTKYLELNGNLISLYSGSTPLEMLSPVDMNSGKISDLGAPTLVTDAARYKDGIVVCTSATRPASPTEGMHIYETDTDKDYKCTVTGTPGTWVEIGTGGVTDHGALTGLADDDHTQYYNSARHTTAIHDALGIDAGSVDGYHGTEFARLTAENIFMGARQYIRGAGGSLANYPSIYMRNATYGTGTEAPVIYVNDAGRIYIGYDSWVQGIWLSDNLQMNGWKIKNNGSDVTFGDDLSMLKATSTYGDIKNAGNVTPGVTDSKTCGSSSLFWSAVYGQALYIDDASTKIDNNAGNMRYTVANGKVFEFVVSPP